MSAIRNMYIQKLIKNKIGPCLLCSAAKKLHTFKVLSSKTENRSKLKELLDDAASFQDMNIIKNGEEQQWATLPYPKGTVIPKLTTRMVPKFDPKDFTIILFPGEDAQYVGMAKSLLKFPVARDLFDLANEILNYDILKLCLEGPKEKLEEVKFSQPAVMVCSLAAIERLKEERPNAIATCIGTAGFSLGEITALVFAGALEFETALQLVKIRGEAMQLASEMYKGGMIRVMYRPDSKLTAACTKAKEWASLQGDPIPTCYVANYLHPHCKVVAGSESALAFLEEHSKEFNLKKIQRLPVAGAFHSDLMSPAVEPFQRALLKSEIKDPHISVYSNVDGKRYSNADHIKKQLPKQIVKPVKWEQLMQYIYKRDEGEDFPRTFICGPGSTLRSNLKEVNVKAWNSSMIVT